MIAVLPLLAAFLGAAPLDPPGSNRDIDERVRELTWYFAEERVPGGDSRRKAARELEKMGSAARAALLRALHDPRVGKDAAHALVWVDPDNKEAVPALVRDLRAQKPGVRRHSCDVLGAFGEKARPAIPALVGALRDPEYDVRWGAAHTLGEVGRWDRRAVVGLVRALGDPSRQVWQEATLSLAKVDPAGARTAAALGALLLDWEPDDSERCLVIRADVLLAAVLDGGLDAVTAVQDYLGRLELVRGCIRNRRLLAATKLAELGPAARPALPALRLAAEDGDPVVRRAAAEVLKKVEGQGRRR